MAGHQRLEHATEDIREASKCIKHIKLIGRVTRCRLQSEASALEKNAKAHSVVVAGSTLTQVVLKWRWGDAS